MNEQTLKLMALVQQLLDDAGVYHSALELYDLDGEAWAREAKYLLEEMRASNR